MSKNVTNPMKVITGPNTRWSYVNAWEPKSINGGSPKYSVSLIISKSDAKTVAKIKAAMDAAYHEGEAKLRGSGKSVPPMTSLKLPLRDGDAERPDDEAYKNSYFINANASNAPGICDDLNGAGYRTVNGCLFQEASLSLLIKNEIYAGDLRRQKSYMEDPITKNKVKNKGELPQYYMQDCHEGILDRETYTKVQAEIARRTSLLNPTYPFTKKIICGCCGNHFTRKKSKMRGKIFYHWICRSKKEVGTTCDSRNYTEAMLERISAGVLGVSEFDATAFTAQVKEMIARPDGSIEFYLTGNQTRTWVDAHLDDFKHTPTCTDAFLGKIHCGRCGNTYHRVNSSGRWIYWYCMGKKLKGSSCSSRNYPDYHLRLISAQVMGMEDFDEDAFMRQVDAIRILADWKFEFHFSDGRVTTWEKA